MTVKCPDCGETYTRVKFGQYLANIINWNEPDLKSATHFRHDGYCDIIGDDIVGETTRRIYHGNGVCIHCGVKIVYDGDNRNSFGVCPVNNWHEINSKLVKKSCNTQTSTTTNSSDSG